MKKLVKISVVASAALLTGAPVFAGGPVFVPAPLPPIAEPLLPDWSGPYAGVQAGMLNGVLPVPAGVTAEFDVDLSGIIYGVHLGYNYDLGNYVVGAEVDYNVGQVDTVSIAETTTEDVTLAHLKARVGYDLGTTLIYGTTGLAYFQAVSPGNTIDDTGFFAGVGAEMKISQNWGIGAEYLYHVFEEFDGNPGDPDLTLHTVMARVSYHF